MKILATYNIKGGVGKTAAAVNLAEVAARQGARVLVWDLDPQGAATFYFRVKPKVKGGGKALVKGKQDLTELGYDVDLLKEFDPLLDGYYANALVSIHSDSCTYVNDQATGYKVAAALGSKQTQRDKSTRLTACLKARYGEETKLDLHNSVTNDMTYYHAFDEIDDETTAAIIEVGFMNLDRQILTQQPENNVVCLPHIYLLYISFRYIIVWLFNFVNR